MIHFVSGKGGVGKSTYAAALALKSAEMGKKTLLVELGESSFQRLVFATQVGYTPVPVASHLSLALWDGESCLREYLTYLLKVERLVHLFFDNKIMHALVQAAPALKEIAILGKATSRERKVGPPLPFEVLVIDAYATGHFRALWRAPSGMNRAIPLGPMGEQTRGIEQVLKDPLKTRIHIVMTPEELALTEGLELAEDVERELGHTPQLVLNRVLPIPLKDEQIQRLPAGDFFSAIQLIDLRQRQALKEIANRHWPNVELPWLLKGESVERVRELAKGHLPL